MEVGEGLKWCVQVELLRQGKKKSSREHGRHSISVKGIPSEVKAIGISTPPSSTLLLLFLSFTISISSSFSLFS